jgi:hypothetical protein
VKPPLARNEKESKNEEQSTIQFEEPLRDQNPEIGTSTRETRVEDYILKEPPSRTRMPYPHVRKNLIVRKKRKNFREALKKMAIYAKFMKELLSKKKGLRKEELI